MSLFDREEVSYISSKKYDSKLETRSQIMRHVTAEQFVLKMHFQIQSRESSNSYYQHKPYDAFHNGKEKSRTREKVLKMTLSTKALEGET